jgi:hypothetical protein
MLLQTFANFSHTNPTQRVNIRSLLLEYMTLFKRLRQQGVNAVEAPALFRDLAKILESGSGIDSAAASLKLQLLGWKHDLLNMELLWDQNGNYYRVHTRW